MRVIRLQKEFGLRSWMANKLLDSARNDLYEAEDNEKLIKLIREGLDSSAKIYPELKEKLIAVIHKEPI